MLSHQCVYNGCDNWCDNRTSTKFIWLTTSYVLPKFNTSYEIIQFHQGRRTIMGLASVTTSIVTKIIFQIIVCYYLLAISEYLHLNMEWYVLFTLLSLTIYYLFWCIFITIVQITATSLLLNVLVCLWKLHFHISSKMCAAFICILLEIEIETEMIRSHFGRQIRNPDKQ